MFTYLDKLERFPLKNGELKNLYRFEQPQSFHFFKISAVTNDCMVSENKFVHLVKLKGLS